jgi:osmotically inducible protein OsmC
MHLTVRGEVDGIDGAGFQQAAETAKEGCPVSNALGGVEISLDASLA